MTMAPGPEASIYERAMAYRAALAAREDAAVVQLRAAYEAAWTRMRGELDALTSRIDAARAAGEPVTPGWLFQQGRMTSLLAQMQRVIADLAPESAAIAGEAQRAAAEAAMRQAVDLMQAALGDVPPQVTIAFDLLPREAIADLVGFTRDGSPLRDLFDALKDGTGASARQALITGVIMGASTDRIARDLRLAFDGNLVRARTIVRTEQMRAYREASRRTYLQNTDIVTRWVWVATVGTRTCPVCWARHGTEYPLDEQMPAHVSCRCSLVPKTKTWRELGFDIAENPALQTTPGPEVFAQLSEDQQRQVLGPRKYQAYTDGTITLPDLVGIQRDRRWGDSVRERSLAEATAAAQRRSGQPS